MTPNDVNDTTCAGVPGGAAALRSPYTQLDGSLSVNAVLASHPSTLRVFNRFGLDTCCGAGLSVADAARAAGVDAEALCSALADAIIA